MKHYIIFILSVIFFLGSASFCGAIANCLKSQKKPIVLVEVNKGTVNYNNSLSNSQFPAKSYGKAMGLTVSRLDTTIQAKTSAQAVGEKGCVALEKVDVNFGFSTLDVYIDKKYRPGTCQYKIIKEHENYHVRVQQEGLEFFKKKVQEAYKIAAEKVDSRLISSPSQIEKVLKNFLKLKMLK